MEYYQQTAREAFVAQASGPEGLTAGQAAARLAKTAQPKEMWLTHYSPSLTKPEEFLDRAREIFPRTVAARDGRTAELEFDED